MCTVPTGCPSGEPGPAIPVVEIPTSAGRRPGDRVAHAIRHLPRDLRLDGSADLEQRSVDAEERALEIGRVRDDAAPHAAGRPGDGDERGDDEAPRE